MTSFTRRSLSCSAFVIIGMWPLAAQDVLFDLDNAPPMTSLPITLTAENITAHFSATGQGFSIQAANTMGFTPAGFGGYCIYPNAVFLADLLVSFDQPITDFSILYACQELGCDDAATMRVTAYAGGALIGTATKTASYPGTWPSDTLRCTFPQGFDSVVVHYDSHPPTCQDYGVIFMADNMRVTPLSTGVNRAISSDRHVSLSPNPTSGLLSIRCTDVCLAKECAIEVRTALGAVLERVPFNGTAVIDLSGLPKGMYVVQVSAGGAAWFSSPVIVQ